MRRIAPGSAPGEQVVDGGAIAGQGSVEHLQHDHRAESRQDLLGLLEGMQFGTLDIHLDHVAASQAGQSDIQRRGLNFVDPVSGGPAAP